MDKKAIKIGVIGAGAIGGVTAAFIKYAGYDVELACKHEDLASKIRTSGLHVFGVRGSHRVRMPAVAKISQLSGPKDIVLLAVKTTDMIGAARHLLPKLRRTSVVVSMQNGICEDVLARILGPERTIGCVIGWSATRHSAGEIEMTSSGKFVIGNINNKPDDRLPMLKKILSAVVPVEISENIRGSQYFKLIVNSCLSSVGAISGLKMGQMISNEKIRNIFLGITSEAMAVADAIGLEMENVEFEGGKFDYYRFLKDRSPLSTLKRGVLIAAIGVKYRRFKSSILQSFERGKPTEIDYLNGYITANGRKHHIPTPVNNRIIDIVKDIEQGRKRISPANLNDPFFAKLG